jgi:hypothetical protein
MHICGDRPRNYGFLELTYQQKENFRTMCMPEVYTKLHKQMLKIEFANTYVLPK